MKDLNELKEIEVPRATAKRLAIYHRYLRFLHDAGKRRISSTELSEAVKVDSATIRRDFSYFGALGKRGFVELSIVLPFHPCCKHAHLFGLFQRFLRLRQTLR